MRSIPIRPHRLRALAGLGSLHLATPLTGTLVTIVTVRALGPSAWGALVANMLIAGLAASMLNWGQRDYLVREMALDPARAVVRWQRNVAARALLLVPVLAALVLVARLALPQQGAAAMGWLLLWTVAMAAMRSFEAPLVRERRASVILLCDLAIAALQVAAVGAAALLRLHDTTQLLALFALADTGRAAARAWVFRRYLARSATTEDGGGRVGLRELGASLPFFAIGLTGMLASRIDGYLVAAFLPDGALGTYQLLIGLMGYVQLAAGVLALAHGGQLARMRPASVLRLALRNLALGVPLCAVAALAIPAVMVLMYRVDLPLSTAALAALASLPIFFYAPVMVRCQRGNLDRRVAVLGLGAMLVTLIAGLWLIPAYGIAGSQLALLAGTVLQAAVTLHWLGGMRTSTGGKTLPVNGPLVCWLRPRLQHRLTPLLQRYFQHRLQVVRYWRWRELSIEIHPEVFSPGHFISTRVVLEYLRRCSLKGLRVLELGCGTGAIATLAASRGADVVASDINPAAVANARANAARNGVGLDVRQSDLFARLGERSFDLLVVTPPYYPRDPASDAERAWFCGSDFDYFTRLFAQLAAREDREVLMILSEDCAIEHIRVLAAEHGLRLVLAAAKRRWFEWNYIFRIERASARDQNPS